MDKHARPPCPSPTPRACPDSRPSRRCHPTVSSSGVPFSSCLQAFPLLGSFPVAFKRKFSLFSCKNDRREKYNSDTHSLDQPYGGNRSLRSACPLSCRKYTSPERVPAGHRLRLPMSNWGIQVLTLVREVRSHRAHGAADKLIKY